MYTSAENLPVWNERDRPTTYLIDKGKLDSDYAALPNSDDGANADYLAWINNHKAPLHAAFRTIQTTATDRLEARSIDLDLIASTVAEIASQEPYPIRRVVTDTDADGLLPYQAAIEDGLFEKAMHFDDDIPIPAQFECALHFVRLHQPYIERTPRCDLIDTCAFSIGQATLSRITYANLEHTPDGTTAHHWHGSVWQHKGASMGELLNDASAAKIAAETRRRLYVFTRGDTHPHPLVETYRHTTGINPPAIGAIALDILGFALNKNNSMDIYRSLWKYIASGQEDAARQELAGMVSYATRLRMPLEALDAQPYSSKGLPLDMLEQIEEYCDVDASMRPSRYLRAAELGQHDHYAPQYTA